MTPSNRIHAPLTMTLVLVGFLLSLHAAAIAADEKAKPKSAPAAAAPSSQVLPDATSTPLLIHRAEGFPLPNNPYPSTIQGSVDRNNEPLAGSPNAKMEPRRPSRLPTRRMAKQIIGGETSVPTGTSSTPALSSIGFDVTVNSVDPQIAAGFQYLVITANTDLWFFDKSGALVGPKKKGNITLPFPNPMSAKQLFHPLFDPNNPDNINHHLNLPPGRSCDPAIDPWTMDLSLQPQVKYCLGYIFDTRVVFDHKRKVFWIVSLVQKRGLTDPYDVPARRSKILLAVSNSEDIREGFRYYWWNATIDDGICNSEDTTQPCPGSLWYPGDATDYPSIAVNDKYFIQTIGAGNASAGRGYALVNVFDADAMAQGSASIDWWYYPPIAGPDGQTISTIIQPLVQHGALPNNLSLLATNYTYTDAQTTKSAVLLMGFEAKTGSSPPLIKFVRVPLKEPYRSVKDGDGPTPDPKFLFRMANMGNNFLKAVYRNNNVYVIGQDCWPTVTTDCIMAIRLVRKNISNFMGLPLDATKPEVERIFGLRHSGEPQSVVNYYGTPGIEVNKNDDMVAVFMRSGATLYPEARYSIYHHNKSDIEPSHLIHKGEGAFPGGIDIAGSAVDPSDDHAIWVAHYWLEGVFGGTPPAKAHIAVRKVVP
jgi:hypothetical protein